uniref:thiamine pyrophosphate-dependent enzyme n=1 Tax=Apilactobacillus quenuiae TaxID=2008377 RepID=UPI000D01D298
KVKDLSFNNPVDDINEIVKYMIRTGKPAYITLPIDVAKIPVSKKIKENIPEILDKKISVRNDNKKLVNKLVSYLNTAQKPVVLVGHEIKNLQLGKYVEKFIKENKVPFTDLALGKCAVNEGLPQFIGTYNGDLSDESIKKVVDSSDLILSLGAKLTDFVTAMFTQSFDERKMISLNNNIISVFGESENYMDSYDFRECISELSNKKFNNNYIFDKKIEQNNFKLTPTNKPLTQDFYDKALVNSLNQGETLVAESGTSFSGLSPMNLGNSVDFVGQPLWASIGYSFPAMIGSQLADKDSRHILSTGEGSLQLTIQELGMLLKKHLNPVVFVINNNGYTVERLIHGMNASYNDVPELNYTLMPKAFGANNDQFLTYNVNTEIDLINALKEASLNKDKFILIQVNMKYNDAPASLAQLGEMISNKNGK